MANTKISALTSATTPVAGTEVLPIVQSSSTKQVSIANLTAGRSVSGTSFVPTGSTIPANGLYLPAANSVGLATNTTNAVYVDASQNVGIGITPSYRLDVSGSIRIATGGDSYFGLGTNKDNYFTTGTTSGKQVFRNSTGTEYLNLDSSGNLTISANNIIQGTAAKGFNFTANTPAAGKTSQLLNWYEEGTFTPVIKFSGNNTGATYSAQVGRYTRIGNRLFFDVQVAFSAKGSSTGTAQLSGLPFSINASSNSGFYINYYGNMLALTSIPYARVNPAASCFNISNGGATGTTDLTDVNFTNTTDFRCSGFYDI